MLFATNGLYAPSTCFLFGEQVGSVWRSGRSCHGANMELIDEALGMSVHAEQCSRE
jgi:hypothetical protein